jgi:hypothetical protein
MPVLTGKTFTPNLLPSKNIGTIQLFFKSFYLITLPFLFWWWCWGLNSGLLAQMLCYLNQSSRSVFGDRVSLFAQTNLDPNPILYFLSCWYDRCLPPCPGFFLLRWSLTVQELWFSQSQPPVQFKMIGTQHYTQGPTVSWDEVWQTVCPGWPHNCDPPDLIFPSS